MKKQISVVLCVLMLCMCCVPAFAAGTAQAGKTGTFTAFCYNVAGLPSLEKNVLHNQTVIGKWVEEHRYDIFATQEDFGYHENLIAQLPSYNCKTMHKGCVPYGDGTNIFTINHPMYNEQHIVWNSLWGMSGDDGADAFSEKGITYCCIEIADGVLIDFYDIHADAYGDEKSVEARRDNFEQLAALVNAREVKRPVIITGDFNEYLTSSDSRIPEIFIDGLGLKDAWCEILNDGSYTDTSKWSHLGSRWGQWDSVERFLYADGDDISLVCTGFEYIYVRNESGESCSDHAAALGTFRYTVKNTTDNSGEELRTGSGTSAFQELIRKIVSFFKALFMGLQNIGYIKEHL